jgi:lipopolysaccharide/colanic/teichoic acid biosynthesis glycosyltransferase
MVKSPIMTSTPTTRRQAFASPVARRQQAQLSWSLAGLLWVGAAYALGLWLQHLQWVTHQFPLTILWCVPPYLLAAHWLYRGAGIPITERVGLLVVTTGTPFLLTPLGFALLQQPYSRGAVLLVYLLSLGWFALGQRRHRRLHVPRLACLDASAPRRLHELVGKDSFDRRSVELVPWPDADGTEVPDLGNLDGVVVDTGAASSEKRSELLSQLKLAHVRLYSVDALAEMLTGRKMLPSHENELWQLDGNPAYDVVKRLVDVGAVIVTLPVWLPLCLLVALAVRLDSPGPALFSQERVGLNGRVFRLWKFRSMQHSPLPASAQFAQRDDPRITRLGRFIRRARLDELPQLWNVLVGDMSLIGPRPEQVQLVESFAARIHAYPYRHLVRPGLTGWAQVLQGYAGNQEETAVKLSYDLYYLAHYSAALDLLILFKTIRIVLSGFGSR